MRKWLGLFLCFAVMLTLAGCGSTSARTGKQPAGVADVLEAGIAEEDALKPEPVNEPAGVTDVLEAGIAEEDALKPEPVNEPETSADGTEGIDVDLTTLSSTMVYSEVYNMLVSPENYIGKTVKMDGSFAFYHDEYSNKDYFACVIADATACCSQGIEFILTDDYTYPDDYPEEGGEICVVGVFDTYQEGDYTYCTLREAKII
ncbi:MAG: hypothetical protein K6F35_03500 [Lachnospiraceae bacterium]|nr:hypothetical protein [Lachnospiraceae bacterium]